MDAMEVEVQVLDEERRASAKQEGLPDLWDACLHSTDRLKSAEIYNRHSRPFRARDRNLQLTLLHTYHQTTTNAVLTEHAETHKTPSNQSGHEAIFRQRMRYSLRFDGEVGGWYQIYLEWFGVFRVLGNILHFGIGIPAGVSSSACYLADSCFK